MQSVLCDILHYPDTKTHVEFHTIWKVSYLDKHNINDVHSRSIIIIMLGFHLKSNDDANTSLSSRLCIYYKLHI